MSRAPDPFRVRYHKTLQASTSAEARAFGFSVVVLTTGYLAVSEHGLPGWAGALAYLGGILLGHVTVGYTALHGEDWDTSEPYRYHAYGAMHVGSVTLAIFAGWGVAALVPGHVLAFFLTAVVAIAVYEVLLGVELALAATTEADDDA